MRSVFSARAACAVTVVNVGVEHDNTDDDLQRIDEDLDLIEDYLQLSWTKMAGPTSGSYSLQSTLALVAISING